MSSKWLVIPVVQCGLGRISEPAGEQGGIFANVQDPTLVYRHSKHRAQGGTPFQEVAMHLTIAGSNCQVHGN